MAYVSDVPKVDSALVKIQVVLWVVFVFAGGQNMGAPATIMNNDIVTFEQFVRSFEQNGSRVIVQTVAGRSGSLFLQSLFDGHPDILMYPGVINFYSTVTLIMGQDLSCWQSVLLESIETWKDIFQEYNIYSKVGRKGNECTDIDSCRILELVKQAIGETVPDRRTLFLAFHYAVGIYFNIDLLRVRIIYFHEHSGYIPPRVLDEIITDFPGCKMLCITRDPRSNYLSIVRWTKNRNQYCQITDRCWRWYLRYLQAINDYSDYFLIIRLEDIQRYREAYVMKLAELLSVDYNDSLLETTFCGKLWWGDNYSTLQSGFRNSAANGSWHRELSRIKVTVLEILLKDELAALGYSAQYQNFGLMHILALLLLPFWQIDDIKSLFIQLRHKNRNTTGMREKVCNLSFLVSQLCLSFRFGFPELIRFLFRGRRNYAHIPDVIVRVDA